MKAVVLRDGELAFEEDLPMPRPRADEVQVRTVLAGVCDTDVQLARGYLSFAGVPGHEFVGVVAAGPAAWEGKRVVGEINCPCGECELCGRGLGRHCRRRTVLGINGRDGVFAEYFTLPAANLYEVPPALSDEQALFVEPLAAALNVAEKNHVRPGAKIAVTGDGKLGLLVAAVISATGADVVVVGHHPRRADRLAAMGRPVPVIKPGDAAEGAYELVVECTGAADGLAHALRYVRPEGTVVLKSTLADPYNIDLAPAVINEVAVVGNRCGPFAAALRLLATGVIDPTPLIEAVHPLAELPALLARGAPGLKHVVSFKGTANA